MGIPNARRDPIQSDINNLTGLRIREAQLIFSAYPIESRTLSRITGRIITLVNETQNQENALPTENENRKL
jgi:hypothetical protein